jgi:hypothetical protein
MKIFVLSSVLELLHAATKRETHKHGEDNRRIAFLNFRCELAEADERNKICKEVCQECNFVYAVY